MIQKPELLLPAGDLKSAKLAIDYGADAVYVGYNRFSARAKAENLSMQEMYEAIKYAHAHGAKIFCAFNILLFNDELEDAINAVAELVGYGVDAFIVQDFGLATMILAHFPMTEVHASTQMAVMNVCGVQTLEALGFDRVVLARETSLAMLRAIRANTKIDLEVFVQGALCVSYSGLCYMSSLQGDRSGNRGQCAQPCRKRYTLLEQDDDKERLVAEGYLLSTKDMNMLKELPSLMTVPVQSLKIEGRMKQPEYVALMSDVYRKHIDHFALGSLVSDDETTHDLRDMALVFNREGFSTAYLYGVPGCSMMSYYTPKNTGIPLGKIVKITKTSCTLRLAETLHTGDGIVLYDEFLKPLWGGYIDCILNDSGKNGKAFTPDDIVTFKHEVQPVELNNVRYCYKTFDKDLSKSLLKVPRSLSRRNSKGTIHFYVQVEKGKAFAFDALLETDKGDTASYHWTSNYVVEPSKNGRSCRDMIEGVFGKLASTGYKVGAIEINGENMVFVPMSVLTKGKNNTVEYFDKLSCEILKKDTDTRQEQYNAKAFVEECLSVLDEIPPQICFEHLPTITVQARTLAQVEAAQKAGAEELNILLMDTHSHDGLTDKEILELSRKIPLIVTLPPILKEVDEERAIAVRCKTLLDGGVRRFMISNIGQIKLLEDLGVEYMASDYQMNLTNDLTASALSQIGVLRQTISLEMDYERMLNLSAIGTVPLELVVYGRLPAMNTRYCPMGSIVGKREIERACMHPCLRKKYFLERDGKRFELANDQFCNVYLLHDEIYSLYKHIKEIKKLSLDYWRVAGTFMSPEDLEWAVMTLIAMRNQLFKTVEMVRPILPLQKNTTDGHFIKGVR